MNRRRTLRELSACLSGHVPDAADWRAIVSLANEHLVTPALFEGIGTCPQVGSHVPAEIKAFLADVHGRSCARNASLSQTLGDALQALNGAGIEPVLLKGCAMWKTGRATQAGNRSSRIVCDLDLLVRPDELERALVTLRGHDFAIIEDQRGRAYHPVVELARPVDAGSIDLHQHPPGSRRIPLVDDVHALCQGIDLDGRRAKLPPPELQILMTVLHDQLLDGHYWRGGFHLRHLLDIAELTRREADIDWQRLLRMCPSPLARSALKAELMAARHVAGANIPDWVVDGLLTRLDFQRHRLFFERPRMGTFLRSIGLNARIWRMLSS